MKKINLINTYNSINMKTFNDPNALLCLLAEPCIDVDDQHGNISNSSSVVPHAIENVLTRGINYSDVFITFNYNYNNNNNNK